MDLQNIKGYNKSYTTLTSINFSVFNKEIHNSTMPEMFSNELEQKLKIEPIVEQEIVKINDDLEPKNNKVLRSFNLLEECSQIDLIEPKVSSNINNLTTYNNIKIYTRDRKSNNCKHIKANNQANILKNNNSYKEGEFDNVMKEEPKSESSSIISTITYTNKKRATPLPINKDKERNEQLANEIMDSFYTFKGNLSKDIRTVKSFNNSCLSISDFKDLKNLVGDICKYYQSQSKAIKEIAVAANIKPLNKDADN